MSKVPKDMQEAYRLSELEMKPIIEALHEAQRKYGVAESD